MSEKIANDIHKILENVGVIQRLYMEKDLDKIIDYMIQNEDWDNLTNEQRAILLEKKWMELKQERYEEKVLLRRGLRLAEKSLMKLMTELTGMPEDIVKKVVNTTGDIGSAAEIILTKHKKKTIVSL